MSNTSFRKYLSEKEQEYASRPFERVNPSILKSHNNTVPGQENKNSISYISHQHARNNNNYYNPERNDENVLIDEYVWKYLLNKFGKINHNTSSIVEEMKKSSLLLKKRKDYENNIQWSHKFIELVELIYLNITKNDNKLTNEIIEKRISAFEEVHKSKEVEEITQKRIQEIKSGFKSGTEMEKDFLMNNSRNRNNIDTSRVQMKAEKPFEYHIRKSISKPLNPLKALNINAFDANSQLNIDFLDISDEQKQALEMKHNKKVLKQSLNSNQPDDTYLPPNLQRHPRLSNRGFKPVALQ